MRVVEKKRKAQKMHQKDEKKPLERKILNLPVEIVEMILEYVWKDIGYTGKDHSKNEAIRKSQRLRRERESDFVHSRNLYETLKTVSQICRAFRQPTLQTLWSSIVINTSYDVRVYSNFIQSVPNFVNTYGQWIQEIIVDARWAKYKHINDTGDFCSMIFGLFHPEVTEMTIQRKKIQTRYPPAEKHCLVPRLSEMIGVQTREESFSLMKKDFHHIFEMAPNLTDLTWDFLLCPFKDFIDEHCQSIKQMTLFSDSFKENDSSLTHIPESVEILNFMGPRGSYYSKLYFDLSLIINFVSERAKRNLRKIKLPSRVRLQDEHFHQLFFIIELEFDDYSSQNHLTLLGAQKRFRRRLMERCERKTKPGWLYELMLELETNDDFSDLTVKSVLWPVRSFDGSTGRLKKMSKAKIQKEKELYQKTEDILNFQIQARSEILP